MIESDYPALFQASDAASLRAQRLFVYLFRLQLLVFLTASFFSCFVWFLTGIVAKIAVILVAALIIVGIFVTWFLRSEKPERVWFDCRAVAESTKSLAWFYMMAVGPYGGQLPVADVNKKFVDDLAAIRRDRPLVEKHIAGRASAVSEISGLMRETRAKPFQERKALFITNRLENQRSWYESKATANRKVAKQWLNGVIVVQAAALILASWRIVSADVALVFVSLLMTTGSSMLAWTQAKRHEELVEPYALAAQELRELSTMGLDVNEQSFQTFVSDVEDCISREHTMWRARRSLGVRFSKQLL